MSKSKTKRARREVKREHHKKAAKSAKVQKPLNAQSQPKPQKQKQNAPTSNSTPIPKPHIQASQKHEVPFGVYDKILLVGEGDFSFTRSLVIEHGCANVTATSFDGEEEVREKYPTFEEIETALKDLTPPVPLFHSIDATKLSTYKTLKGDEEPYDIIAFQFPHTGGLSTDVNRQVRSNQALLVSFFKSCLEIPTKPTISTTTITATNNSSSPASKPPPKKKKKHATREFLKMGGRIIVTLFESEPYTLWNIRDLARHSGLKVVESFRFDWEQYPGYSHVRTLGAIEGGGGWKGEERNARVYVFEKIPLEPDSEEEKERRQRQAKSKKRKRGPDDGGSKSESDEDD